MKPETVNPLLVNYLNSEIVATPLDLSRIVKYGVQLVHANNFQNFVAVSLGADCVHILTEFYRNYLGKYDYICVSKSPAQIRFCNQIGDAHEGRELRFLESRVQLFQLAATFNVTTFKLVKEWKK